MASRELTVEEIMAILPETSGRLSDLTDGLTDDQLHAAPEPGAWSVNDVLAHLRACNDVLGRNVRRILDEDNPAWKAMSPRTWQAKSGYHDWAFREAFEAFKTQRAELLAALDGVPSAAWEERTATVSVPPNKTFHYTARYYGSWLASHERAHLKSLPSIIAAVRGET